MAFSANNPAGLPSDAFDDFLDSGGLTVGVNYLRTLKHVKTVGAEKVDLYGNLQVAKRRPSTSSMVHHHHAPKEGGNSSPTSPVQRVKPGSAGGILSKSTPNLHSMMGAKGDNSASIDLRGSTNQLPAASKGPIITLRPPPRPNTSDIILAQKKPPPMSRSARAASSHGSRKARR